MDQASGEYENQWRYTTSRWLEYEGEVRAALVRVALVAAFYAVQLLHFLVFSERSPAEEIFHRQATYLAAAWFFVSLGVLVVLSRQWLPRGLKYITSGLDVALLTAVAGLGSGPASPMVFGFGLLIALAGLRGSVPLVWFVTLAAMLGYMALVGQRDEHWFDAVHTTPVVQQIVVELTLAVTGIVVGQLVRMPRRVSEEMLQRQRSLEEQPA
ncbi:MAG: hypothetical protein ACTHK7_01530 [Aureliella sp.]